jgi:uncharacterized protein (TIGR00369 family)
MRCRAGRGTSAARVRIWAIVAACPRRRTSTTRHSQEVVALNIRETAGIDLLRAMQEGKIPYATIADTVPMRIAALDKGVVRFTVKADRRHINPLGGVHGGFAATVLDSVTGCAIHSLLEAGVGYSTVDINVKMLRPIPLDEELHAEGRVLNLSKNLGVSEGVIRDANGKLYAHATSTCLILRSPAA